MTFESFLYLYRLFWTLWLKCWCCVFLVGKSFFSQTEILKVKPRKLAHVTCCEGRRKNIGRQGKIIRVNTFKTVVRHLVTHLLQTAALPPSPSSRAPVFSALPSPQCTKYPGSTENLQNRYWAVQIINPCFLGIQNLLILIYLTSSFIYILICNCICLLIRQGVFGYRAFGWHPNCNLADLQWRPRGQVGWPKHFWAPGLKIYPCL